MIETLTIVTLCVLYLVFFRPGKTPPLDSPLVIQRPGQYHMTLAPKLNLAQPFIEAVATQLGKAQGTARNSATQCFEVNDKHVTAHGHGCYLLAITQRNGMLYFHAIAPNSQMQDSTSRYDTLMEAAHTALAHIPADSIQDVESDDRIVAATSNAAQKQQVEIQHLSAPA